MNARDDGRYIERCLELARRGEGSVSPNPLVGCVIVRAGKIIAEGYHARFGGPHAEVVALRRAGRAAQGATLYVNLEPCSHHGKTPPCTEQIIAAGIKRVVASTKDPNPLVAGSGFRKLRAAGLRVRVGVHRRAAEELNEHFLTYMRTGMPFVGIKVAQTLDGRIADAWGDSQWITGAAARTHAHKLRTTYDAILIGARTVQQDNPRLTVRRVKGKNPVRVVVDGRLSVQHTARVFNAQVSRTLLLTSVGALRRFPEKVKRLTRRGVDVIAVGNNVLLHPAAILRVLAHLNLSSVLIEGGSRTIGTFLDAGLVHKVHCFLAPRILGSGLNGWQQRRERRLSHALQLKQIKLSSFGHDFLIEGTLASYDH